jgi:hypothetical protein
VLFCFPCSVLRSQQARSFCYFSLPLSPSPPKGHTNGDERRCDRGEEGEKIRKIGLNGKRREGRSSRTRRWELVQGQPMSW